MIVVSVSREVRTLMIGKMSLVVILVFALCRELRGSERMSVTFWNRSARNFF